MVKKIIVNADDFGLCDGVSLGILKAYRDGILTSTTCMMNMEKIEKHLNWTKEHPGLGLGVHLNITVGKALTKNSFIDEKGYFLNQSVYKDKKPVVDQEELYIEWKAQIDKFIKIMKRLPTHLDSHHHVHLIKEYKDVILRLKKEYEIPVRGLEDDIYFEEVFYDQSATFETLEKIKDDKHEIYEIMCHPAFIDFDLYKGSSYCFQRTKELELLCDEKTKQLFQNIKQIHY